MRLFCLKKRYDFKVTKILMIKYYDKSKKQFYLQLKLLIKFYSDNK